MYIYIYIYIYILIYIYIYLYILLSIAHDIQPCYFSFLNLDFSLSWIAKPEIRSLILIFLTK